MWIAACFLTHRHPSSPGRRYWTRQNHNHEPQRNGWTGSAQSSHHDRFDGPSIFENPHTQIISTNGEGPVMTHQAWIYGSLARWLVWWSSNITWHQRKSCRNSQFVFDVQFGCEEERSEHRTITTTPQRGPRTQENSVLFVVSRLRSGSWFVLSRLAAFDGRSVRRHRGVVPWRGGRWRYDEPTVPLDYPTIAADTVRSG